MTANPEPPPRKSLLAHPGVWVLFTGIILVGVARSMFWDPAPSTRSPDDTRATTQEILGEVPSFRLVTPEGRDFGSEDLHGTVYVANFFFTRCPTMCPALMGAMAHLDRRYRDQGVEDVHLVSFTVDPETDRPEHLAQYARTQRIDPARWTLLTGERERISKLLVEGFRVAMGDRQIVGENLIDIAHSGKFVLVDQQGRIRGFFNHDGVGLDAVFEQSLDLAKEKP